MIVAWGAPYGFQIAKPDGERVRMYRNRRNRVRWITASGRQVGPEQTNVAQALAWAMAQGWNTSEEAA